jgi:hypothetical protein
MARLLRSLKIRALLGPVPLPIPVSALGLFIAFAVLPASASAQATQTTDTEPAQPAQATQPADTEPAQPAQATQPAETDVARTAPEAGRLDLRMRHLPRFRDNDETSGPGGVSATRDPGRAERGCRRGELLFDWKDGRPAWVAGGISLSNRMAPRRTAGARAAAPLGADKGAPSPLRQCPRQRQERPAPEHRGVQAFGARSSERHGHACSPRREALGVAGRNPDQRRAGRWRARGAAARRREHALPRRTSNSTPS